MSECNSVEKTYQKNRLNGVKDYNKNDRGRLRQQARGYMHKFICRRKQIKREYGIDVIICLKERNKN